MGVITEYKTVADQLSDIYFNKENWYLSEKLSKQEAYSYHENLYYKGNIEVYKVDDIVIGYVEFWKITFEQLGRIICHAPFSAYLENVTDGNVAYVANTYIEPAYRKSNVYYTLRNQFFKQCRHCDYFVGDARRKKTGLIKVYNKAQLVNKLYKEGE
jgi:hypothetical protein